jgi:predicted homoserine dehydrogenase-like protein
MHIIDTALRKRADEGNPIRVGVIGAGFMADGLTNQIVNSTPGMTLVAIANRTPEKGTELFAKAGVTSRRVETAADFQQAIESGVPAVTGDPFLLCESPLVDVIVEVTGAIEYSAHIVLRAIEHGKHVVLMNAELDGTIGPILKTYADRAGVVLTGCDGDQPGVEMNLFRFVKGMGLTPLVCGNIKGLQDPYRNPTTQAGFAEKWGQNPTMVTSFADGTKISFEQAIVANATGMRVARRAMVGAEFAGHVDDLTTHYDIDELRASGGVVDYVVGFNIKPGPGVYVLATHDDPKQRHYLNLYKLGEGPLYSFYTPYHLCHFEVPSSIARAVIFGDAVIQPLDGPLVDVITTAKADLAAGTVIDGLGGYHTYGQAENHSVVRADSLLPMGLAEGCVLRRAVVKDTVLTYDDVDIPAGRLCDALRREQDDRWPA